MLIWPFLHYVHTYTHTYVNIRAYKYILSFDLYPRYQSGDTVSLQRHSSSSVRNFQGVTVLQLVKNGGCFVTACSSGVVNVWQLPMRCKTRISLIDTIVVFSVDWASCKYVNRRNSYMATAPASPTAPAAPEPVKKKSFTQLLSATLRGSREAAPISRAGSPVPTAATRNNRKCIATLKVKRLTMTPSKCAT